MSKRIDIKKPSPSVMVIWPADLGKLPGFQNLHESTLRRYTQYIRDFAEKKKPRPLTVADLADWLGAKPEEVIPIIFPQYEKIA